MKRKLIVILMICSIMIVLSGGTIATAATPEEEIKDGVLWKYHGQEESYIIPPEVTRIKTGAFYKSPVKTVIIPQDVIISINCFIGAYNLTDLYIYDPGLTHLYSFYEGTPCLENGLGCMNKECSDFNTPTGFYSTILNNEWADHDKYISKTLTIHGYKGSTAERFVEMVNSHPESFNRPQELIFEPIEEGSKIPLPGLTESSTVDDNDSTGESIPPITEEPSGDATEPPDKNNETTKGDLHLRGDGITKVVIKDNGIVTYPRIVYMKVGSKYFLELGSLPDGYSYVIPNTKSSLYSLNPQTGEFVGLKKGATMIKIRLYYPDNCYSNLRCQIYIEGEENEAT